MTAGAAIPVQASPRLPRGVRLKHDRVRSRWVLLAPERIFEIDDTGVEILKRCDGRPYGEMLADIAQAFSVEPAEIKPDVDQFLSEFAAKRVLDL